MEVHQLKPKTATGRYPLNPQHQPFFPGSSRNTTAETTTAKTTTATTATANTNNGSSLQGGKPEYKCGIKECAAYILCLLIIALVFGIAFAIGLVSHSYVQPECSIDSVTVYPFNVSSSHITANWNITFSFDADDTHSSNYYLRDIHATVFYKAKNISSTMIRPVSADIEHKVEANFGVHSAYLNSSIGEAMVADCSLGAVNFNIKVNAIVRRIDYESQKDETKHMSVSCEHVTIGFSSDKKTPGKMMGGSKRCKKVSIKKHR